MGLGFTFNGVHSSNFGVVQTINRPLLPNAKTSFVSNNFMNGAIDFSKCNDDNRLFYDDRIIDVKLQVKDIVNLTARLNEIKGWLFGAEGRLIFDDENDRYYSAKFYNTIDFAPQIMNNYAELTLTFRCSPFLCSVNEFEENVVISAAEPNKVINISGGTYYSYPIITFTYTGKGTNMEYIEMVVEQTKAPFELKKSSLMLNCMHGAKYVITYDYEKRISYRDGVVWSANLGEMEFAQENRLTFTGKYLPEEGEGFINIKYKKMYV